MLQTNYETDKSDLEKKIPDTSGLTNKTNYNAEITEIENKIPNITVQDSFAGIDKVFALGGRLGTRLKFHEALTLF